VNSSDVAQQTDDQAIVAFKYMLERPDFTLDTECTFPARGITGIFGQSGSGKTTLLRCIAGLEPSAHGRLNVNGDVWQDSDDDVCLPPYRRRIGYVFQDARLFPHLDVERNLRYGMQRNHGNDSRVDFQQVIELMELGSMLDRRPNELSGGEAQRVAIARALLRAPRLVLMDEPLAALDIMRRAEIFPFLDRLHAELELPVLYVSHSIDEVCRLCDNLIVMQAGRIQASDELPIVLEQLDLPLLAGDEVSSVIDGKVIEYDKDYDLTTVQFSGGHLLLPGVHGPIDGPLRLRIRANDVSLCRTKPEQSTILNILPATVREVRPEPGAYMRIGLVLGSDSLTARITRRSGEALKLSPGDQVFAQIKGLAVKR
jgi:molybdate transport system ATP-binding protein